MPICGKVFKHLIFKNLFKCLKENNILFWYQLDFISGDKLKNLYPSLYGVYKVFDGRHPVNVRTVFLNISKAFNEILYDEGGEL